MTDDNCPFCARIGRGEFDYHDQWSVSFQPLNPVTPGHFLVVPRKHVATALEPLAPIVLGGAMRLAAILARQMDLTDCNFINSAGAAATQSVMHLHVHCVPRRVGDGLALPWTGQQERDWLATEVARYLCSVKAGHTSEAVVATARSLAGRLGSNRGDRELLTSILTGEALA